MSKVVYTIEQRVEQLVEKLRLWEIQAECMKCGTIASYGNADVVEEISNLKIYYIVKCPTCSYPTELRPENNNHIYCLQFQRNMLQSLRTVAERNKALDHRTGPYR